MKNFIKLFGVIAILAIITSGSSVCFAGEGPGSLSRMGEETNLQEFLYPYGLSWSEYSGEHYFTGYNPANTYGRLNDAEDMHKEKQILPEMEGWHDLFPGRWGYNLNHFQSPMQPGGSLSSIASRLTEDVEEAWVSQYASGLAPSKDRAQAVAIDDLGNVYVTGSSTNLPFGVDYLTAKFDTSGTLIWIARYMGEGGANTPYAIAVDDA